MINLGPLRGLVGTPRSAEDGSLAESRRIIFGLHYELDKLRLGRVLELLVLGQGNKVLESINLVVLDLVLGGTEDLIQLGPLPVGRDVVVTLLGAPDTALDGVTGVVDKEDGHWEVETDYGGHFLDGHHSRAVTLDEVHTLVLVGGDSLAHGSTECSRERKADRRVVVLREVSGVLGQSAAASAVLEGTGLGNESVTRSQELGDDVRKSKLSDGALELRIREVDLGPGGVDVRRNLDRELLQHTIENMAEVHVVIVFAENASVEGMDNNEFGVVDRSRHTTRVEVRDVGTNVQDEVTVLLDSLGDTLQGDLAVVNTTELGMSLLYRRSAEERAVAISTRALKNLHSALLHVEAGCEQIVENNRSLGLGKSIEDGLGNLIGRRVEGKLGSNLLGKVGGADRKANHVCGNEKRSGLLKLHDLVNEVVDLGSGLLNVPKFFGNTAQWLTSLLVVSMVIGTQTVRSRRVVKKKVLVLSKARRLSNDVDNGDVFGICTRDTVESAQLTDCVSGNNHAGFAGLTCIAVGSISTIELVTRSNPLEALNVVNVIQKLEVEITRHTEDVLYADLVQALEEIGTQRDF